ncbi:MAG: hypothetical protein E7356_02720 [Clostridiales bacterium]|nr:hypothetical protein [Clostridiales bacterium]
MFVRVFDKENNLYYKSVVYGVIDSGYYEKYIVINPHTNNFELINYFDENSNVQIEKIQTQRIDWVEYNDSHLLIFKKKCKIANKDLQLTSFVGYKEVFDNFDFLSSILEHRKVAVQDSGIEIKCLTDINEWNYIRNQEDVDNLMKNMVGFHDALMTSLVVEQDFTSTKVNAVFDNSGWYGIVELCFEGVLGVKLCPAKENYSNEIYGATLKLENEIILWADNNVESEEDCQQCSYIKSLNLKWRKID